MLWNMFWNGLSENIKDITGYIFKESTEFDVLRKAISVRLDRINLEGKTLRKLVSVKL